MFFEDKVICPYKKTNENLKGIILSLEPKEEDVVFSIGIDQSLAFLEFSDKVVFLDYSHRQINAMNYKLGLLKDGRFESFLQFSSDYFKTKDLGRIRGNLDKLVIVESNFFDFDFNKLNLNFSKIYLSNLLSYKEISKPKIIDSIELLSGCSISGSLFYVSRGLREERYLKALGLLEKDSYLSEIAFAYSKEKGDFIKWWSPAVYRKK